MTGFFKRPEAKAERAKQRRRIELCRHVAPIKKRTPVFSDWGSIKKGDDILSHITAVPSAQAGLTTLFGMGRGEPRRNNHLKVVKALANSFKLLVFARVH